MVNAGLIVNPCTQNTSPYILPILYCGQWVRTPPSLSVSRWYHSYIRRLEGRSYTIISARDVPGTLSVHTLHVDVHNVYNYTRVCTHVFTWGRPVRPMFSLPSCSWGVWHRQGRSFPRVIQTSARLPRLLPPETDANSCQLCAYLSALLCYGRRFFSVSWLYELFLGCVFSE